MSAWTAVPCLIVLRTEFNRISPDRDRGADGTIGDSNHNSASDHTPDEDSSILRGRDADSNNEVHGLDIDSSGPWPGGAPWFDRTIKAIVAREKADYESPTIVGRLQYVIWDGQIASRSWGWTWRPYEGTDPHTNHAHFSARYVSAAEADTRSWGIAPETANRGDDVDAADIEAIAKAVWALKIQDPYEPANPDRALPAGTWLKYGTSRGQVAGIDNAVKAIRAGVEALAASVDQVDEQTASAIFGGTDEQLIPVLREALGSERLRTLASKVLAAG